MCFTGQMGKIHWNNNWVTFMDSMFQAQLFHTDGRSLFIPIAIQKLTIDMKQHTACLQELGSVTEELGEIHTPYAPCQAVAESCVHGNRPLGTMEGREFHTYLSDSFLLKFGSSLCSYLLTI